MTIALTEPDFLLSILIKIKKMNGKEKNVSLLLCIVMDAPPYTATTCNPFICFLTRLQSLPITLNQAQ